MDVPFRTWSHPWASCLLHWILILNKKQHMKCLYPLLFLLDINFVLHLSFFSSCFHIHLFKYKKNIKETFLSSQIYFSVMYREIVQHLLKQCLNPKLSTYLFLLPASLYYIFWIHIKNFLSFFISWMFLWVFLENLLSYFIFITLRCKHANIVSSEKMKLRESFDVDIKSDASSQKQKKYKDVINAILASCECN